ALVYIHKCLTIILNHATFIFFPLLPLLHYSKFFVRHKQYACLAVQTGLGNHNTPNASVLARMLEHRIKIVLPSGREAGAR
ncbi:hypothetical protein C7212DRAFT_318610, partial [Tuber magnatum]